MLGRILVAFFASSIKNISVDTHFSNQFTKQIIHYSRELLKNVLEGMRTYFVDSRELKLVFFFIVENQAVFFYKAHNWCFPSWTLQECY